MKKKWKHRCDMRSVYSHTLLQCKSLVVAKLHCSSLTPACWRWLPHLSVSSRRCSWCRSLNGSKALTTDWLQIREGSRSEWRKWHQNGPHAADSARGLSSPWCSQESTHQKKNVTQRSNFLKSPSSTTGRRCTTTSVCVHEWSKNMSQQIWKNRQEVAATRLGI